MTKMVLLKLTDNEKQILSDTLEMEIQIEDEQGDDELVKYYTKLDERLWKTNRFTQKEIGIFSNLSWEQENHYGDTHEKLSNDYGWGRQMASKLDWTLGVKTND